MAQAFSLAPCCVPSSSQEQVLNTASSSFAALLLSHRFACRSRVASPKERFVMYLRTFTSYPGRRVKIEAVDAAQAFDYEAKKRQEIEEAARLKIGIVGFGNFGQFLAQKIVQQGHTVLAHSRSDYSGTAFRIGVSFFRDPDDFCEEHPEVILLCTSILSTESVLHSLPLQRLRRNTLFVDVLSVKEFPRNLFLRVLPAEFDILCTHPMFGPQSGKANWIGLPFVYDMVRIGEGARADRCQNFLNIFGCEGCRMVQMTCEEHDRYAAGSQFITHTVGRVLGKLSLESTPINTKGYEQLLHLVENTNSDSFDLYYGLFMYNVNATDQLERLELAFDSVKKQLFSQLHDILRKQMFGAREQVSTETKSTILFENEGAGRFTEKASVSSLKSVDSVASNKPFADFNDFMKVN